MPEILLPTPRRLDLGWSPDRPDHRDTHYRPDLLTLQAAAELTRVDLRERGLLGPVLNQLALGSCTANAISGAIQYQERKQQDKVLVTPSRLFIYWLERFVEGTVGSDSGAALRDGMKVVNTAGYPDESAWPYDISKFTERPPLGVFAAARKDRVLRYQRIQQDVTHMKAWLASGHSFVGGITVASSFPMQTGTGQVPLPNPWDSVEGGHALHWVGYDDAVQIGSCSGAFIFQNSWDVVWGDAGFGYLPYQYLADPNLARDFWGITLES
jgi:C1A family cysteine protease